MKTKTFYYSFIFIFAIYLVWVWFFDIDYSSIPPHVKSAWFMQEMPHWLLSDDVLLYVYDIRKPLAFLSLLLLLFHNNFGKWGFLLFSISGPLLHTEGWGYQLDWVTDLEWAVQMVQGGLIAMCFIGAESLKFQWAFSKRWWVPGT